MFKNLTIYRLVSPWTQSASQLEEALGTMRFVKCGATQEKSVGWVEPRGHDNGPLVEVVGGQVILKLMIETKAVPTRAVADKVAEKVKEIEESTGRKPGKKERREIGDEIRLTLLPMAFTKVGAVMVWIDPQAKTLVVDAASQAKADEVMTCLIKAIDGLVVQLVSTLMAPATAMAMWLSTKDAPQGFSVDRECELKAADESKAVVRYSRHSLDTDEVAQHIACGKVPTKLALTWSDRVSFVLTDAMVLKKVALLDVVIEDTRGAQDGKEDGFDADVAITTGELCKLLPDLFDALGGVSEVPQESGLQTVAAAGTNQIISSDEEQFQKAIDIVKSNNKASVSLIQRHLQIGYNAAARLMEAMEVRGLVSTMRSDGSRTVLAA